MATMSTEIIFEVTEDADGGYNASALGFGIHTQADTADALRAAVRDAAATYFDDPAQAPRIIRLHYTRDEVMAA